MLAECEMVGLHITDKKCNERTHIVLDWCDVCRSRIK